MPGAVLRRVGAWSFALQEVSPLTLEPIEYGVALEHVEFNQTRAADLLGTTRRILKYRMDKLGIQADD